MGQENWIHSQDKNCLNIYDPESNHQVNIYTNMQNNHRFVIFSDKRQCLGNTDFENEVRTKVNYFFNKMKLLEQ